MTETKLKKQTWQNRVKTQIENKTTNPNGNCEFSREKKNKAY